MIHARRQHLARRLDDAELPGKFVLSDGMQHGINGFVDGRKRGKPRYTLQCTGAD
jgi:hypothetical protein